MAGSQPQAQRHLGGGCSAVLRELLRKSLRRPRNDGAGQCNIQREIGSRGRNILKQPDDTLGVDWASQPGGIMKISAGFNIAYQCPQPTQMLLVLDVHPSRRPDLLSEAIILFDPPVEARGYIDSFGNACTRVTAPTGVYRCRRSFLSMTAAVRMSWRGTLSSMTSKICQTTCSSSCLAAAIATPTGSAISPGPTSRTRPRAGRGFRQSATSYTAT